MSHALDPSGATAAPAPGAPIALQQARTHRAWRNAVSAAVVAGFVVAVMAWGIFRARAWAGIVLLVAAYGGALALVFAGSRTVKGVDNPAHQSWARRLVRLSYALGLIGGLGIARIGTNVGVRWVVLLTLAGLHVLAAVSVLTLAVQWDSKRWHQVDRGSLVITALSAVGATVGCWLVDRRPTCTTPPHCSGPLREVFGIGTPLYVVVIAVLGLAAVGATINYLHRRPQRFQAVSVSATASIAVFAAGALLIVATVSGTAWWRNRAPVDGPRLERLPAIAGVTGEYVALGDSYSAGEGLEPFEAYTGSDAARLGNACHRSSQAYPELLRFSGPAPARLFVACSGAVTNDLYHPRPAGGGGVAVEPQVSTGDRPDVGLVTITIGGNDLGFSKVLTFCFLSSDCTKKVPPEPPLPAIAGAAAPTNLAEWGTAALDALSGRLGGTKGIYAQLHESYPKARILVIGYPYLFPADDASIVGLSDCQTVLRRFSPDERRAIRALQDDLTQRMHDDAIGAGVEFVSAIDTWKGHEPCATSGDQYTNSIKPFSISALRGFTPGDGGTFHPNAAGQRALAALVTCYLVDHPAAPTSRVGAPAIGTAAAPLADCTR